METRLYWWRAGNEIVCGSKYDYSECDIEWELEHHYSFLSRDEAYKFTLKELREEINGYLSSIRRTKQALDKFERDYEEN